MAEQRKESAPLQALVRPSALDVRGQQPSLFPFDAFKFDDPNQTDFPELKMKAPWRFVADYIKSSGDSWNYSGNVGQIPSGAYFSALRYTNETSVALLNKADDDLLASEGVSGIEEGVSPYTIAGTISYDLTGIPAYVLDGGYTIIVYSEFTGWEYLSGSGVSKGNLISKVGDVFTLTSSNTLPQLLKFRLRGYLETFRDLMVIPQNYTQSSIDDLLEDVTTFSWESGTLSSDRGYILSPDGFYWYNGAQYIKLGTEAIFSGVDLKSGQWDGEITNGEITSNGTEGWALSSKGDFEANDGTFRGDMLIGSDDDLRQLYLGSKGLYVEDKNDVPIHDLPNAPTITNGYTLGHLYYNDGVGSQFQIYNNTSAPMEAWTEIQGNSYSSTNAKGGLFKIFISGIGTSNSADPYLYLFMRPKGSSWSSTAGGLSPELRIYLHHGAELTSQMSYAGNITCPFGTSNKLEFYWKTNLSGSAHQVTIVQLGVYI